MKSYDCKEIIDLIKSYINKPYTTKLTQIKKLFNKNYNKYIKFIDVDSEVQFIFGINEIFFKKNIEAALKYFEISANNGNIDACYQLGMAYYQIIEVRNDKLAEKYLTICADNGCIESQLKLGKLYCSIDMKNDELAQKYLTICADNNSAYGQYLLGGFYFSNEKYLNNELAIKYFKMYITNGYDDIEHIKELVKKLEIQNN